MKKLTAILAIGILLFNWGGYRWMFTLLEKNTSQVLNARLDDGSYEEASLITLKIPVQNLPYYTNSPIFERVKGEITIGGMKYQYVEKRIFNDSVEMKCIPNAEATHLTNARYEFFKMVNDLQQTSSSGKQSGKHIDAPKSLLSDYETNDYLTISAQKIQLPQLHFPELPAMTPDRPHSPREQPPDFC